MSEEQKVTDIEEAVSVKEEPIEELIEDIEDNSIIKPKKTKKPFVMTEKRKAAFAKAQQARKKNIELKKQEKKVVKKKVVKKKVVESESESNSSDSDPEPRYNFSVAFV